MPVLIQLAPFRLGARVAASTDPPPRYCAHVASPERHIREHFNMRDRSSLEPMDRAMSYYIAAFLVLSAQTVLAQSVQPPPIQTPPPIVQPDPKACAPGERATVGQVPEMTPQTRSPGGTPPEDLTDKLARTDGVICPPSNIDPEIHTPAPGGGVMPVIPPPGSPGGDPSVRPK
jgi:hypothetical protein